jgi:hypothetical protein
MPKATYIRIEFEDGSTLSAEGPEANSIWGWWQTAQTFAFIHGQDYKGPQLTKTTKLKETK